MRRAGGLVNRGSAVVTGKKSKSKLAKEAPDAAAAVGATGLAIASVALTAGAAPLLLAIAAAGGAGPYVIKRAAELWIEARDARWARWFEALARSAGRTPDEVAAAVAEQINDPVARQVVVDSVRATESAVDDAAVPLLATLAWSYTSRGRPVDAFFRGTTRVLCDASAVELAELRHFVDWLGARVAAGERVRIGYVETSGGYEVHRRTRLGGAVDEPVLAVTAGMRGVLDLLQIHRVVSPDEGGWPGEDWLDTAHVITSAETILRLRDVLGSGTP